MSRSHVLAVVPLVVLGCAEQGDRDSQTSSSLEQSGRFESFALDQAAGGFTPRSLGGSQRETYVVELSGSPVALAQAAAGRKLTGSEKQAIRDQLAPGQDAVAPQIQALGGQVVAHYRDAIDGLRVRLDPAQVAAVRSLSGVVAVRRVPVYEQMNTNGVPRIAAPGAWSSFAGADGFRGEGVKIAIIDTGIDYTHRDFGGPGTPDAYTAAHATSTAPADPALFGPGAPKVKGGTDLVGDDYNAAGSGDALVPHPDPNPLDCGGHGSHVAGTAAGFGVLADGSQYTGPYDSTTYTGRSFLVGPGVAPHADLYAVRVFGCAGSTDVVVDALDWAVANDMDVVNMSLGSNFGGGDTADAVASDNASRAGVVVVAASGNAGPIRYVTSSPAAAPTAISVAAQDPTPSFPGARLTSGATNISLINANGAAIPSAAMPVKVLRNANGTVSLGCNPAEYVGVTGALVVTTRGTCARVARAIYGQKAGAAAVLMINNATDLPPFEGAITSNPDTGEAYTVTIPFLGARSTSGAAIVALDGQTATLTAIDLANPGYNTIASFSSQGPRDFDGHLKPEVTAPGVSIRSVGMGTGNQGVVMSGTSMATPHVAGLAALARQAHPSWSVAAIKAAIMNTSSPADVVSYKTSLAGAGLVNASNAAHTQAYAFADPDEVSLSLGVIESQGDIVKAKSVKVRNEGDAAITFNVGSEAKQGAPHTVTPGAGSITVAPHQTASVTVTLSIPAATAGNSDAFREAAGVITLSPTSGNNGVALRVPYYVVLRPQSNVNVSIAPKLSTSKPSGVATVSNGGGAIAGNADFYAWGLSDGADQAGYVDLRAVGTQSFPLGASDSLIVFAMNTNAMWYTPSLLDMEVVIDSNGDGIADFVVIGADLHFFNGASQPDGRIASAVFNVATGAISVRFLAQAPTNGSTILLPVSGSQIGVSQANPRFVYSAQAFDLNSDDQDSVNAAAIFNAFNNSISTGAFVSVAPGASTKVPVALNPSEWANSPSLGTMVVTQDNKSGVSEAALIPTAP